MIVQPFDNNSHSLTNDYYESDSIDFLHKCDDLLNRRDICFKSKMAQMR